MSDSTRDLLVRGVAAAKTNDAREAKFYLEWVLRLDPPLSEKIDALFWLCELSNDPAQQRDYLETILAGDPTEVRAHKKLAELDGRLDPRDVVDPDRLVQPAPSEPQPAQARRFNCPNCGGRLTYSPDGKSLVCEYCETQQRLAAKERPPARVAEKDFLVANATARGHLRPSAFNAITCQGCGASFVLSPEELSKPCPYCGTPYALDQAQTREIDRPDGIIPFGVDEKQARHVLRGWLEKQGFDPLPKVASGRGLFLPVWTFDVGGVVRWTCQVRSGDRWEPRSGERLVHHNDLPIFATRRLPEALLLAVTGYRLKEMLPFDEAYLAGRMAETYQVPASDSSLSAREYALFQARRKIEDGFLEPVRDLRVDSSRILVESYRLILVPAWRTYLLHKQRRVDVLINGQTGEVTGDRPASGFAGLFKRVFEG